MTDDKLNPPPPPTSPPAAPAAMASFGYREVAASAKSHLVRELFDSVAKRYDLMNDLMSVGVHRLWKSAFVDKLAPKPGLRLLDLAGGTGDIAFRVLERAPTAQVTIADLTFGMLSVGRDRAIDRGVNQLDLVCANAESLPFPDRSFDAVTIAFGLRNVTHIEQALREVRRILRPGGRFLCLEFSRVAIPALERLYDVYSFQVLPRLGDWVAKDRDAYVYLAESIRRFPPQEELVQRMKDAGFGKSGYTNLSGGIAAVHSGWRL